MADRKYFHQINSNGKLLPWFKEIDETYYNSILETETEILSRSTN